MMSSTTDTTAATAAFSFVTAILKELDARDPGFAAAVFTRVEADMAAHNGAGSYPDELAEGLAWARSEFPDG
ncbi:MAG: hypothetical protein C0494_17040 [Sphingobium sp.]|nr:hypothetical protein [Sphingobium sp.]